MKGPTSRGITTLLVFLIMVAVFGRPLPAYATAPVVTINLPSDGTSEDYGNSIDFSGSASDPADGDAIESYRWTSSIDGELATSASFTTTTLSVGTHTIRLFATDENDEQGFDAITVTINEITPDVAITSPSDGSEYDYGDPLQTAGGVNVAFECTASDIQDDSGGADDGDIELSWSSSIDGIFGSLNDDGSPSLSPVTLSSGSHTITVTATDSDGYTATDSIGITVNNTPPDTVSITNPPDGSSFDYGDLVTFQGTATDPEDGTLTGADLVWTSSQGDPMGTGETFATDTLTSGTHVITLTASDSKGMSATDTITIEVGNAPPEAEIVSPATGSEYAYREYITFEGTGTDPEDGTLSGGSLVWTSSTSTDPIGQGEVISVNDLPSGTHTITLTVTDSEGAEDTDSITVVVGNAPPVATITSPANNSSHNYGSSVTFTGTGTDAEDGELSGESLSWTSDKDGFLGTGTTVSTSELSVGSHVITLTVTDSESATDTDTITISIGDEPPTSVTISEPDDGEEFYYGNFIEFIGSATDNEDGDLTGSSLVWTSSEVAGTIGTGETFSINTLPIGEHLITLTATDSNGASVSTFNVIEVKNTLPVAQITVPSDGASFEEGDVITFSGSATDEEDGNLTGSSLVWTSNIDEIIGVGVDFTSKTLSPGEHTITLTAIDSHGGQVSTTVSITVTAAEGGQPLSTDTSEITVALDQNASVTVSGGHGPYRVSCNYPQIVDLELSGNTVTIMPLEVGETSVNISDHYEDTVVVDIEVTDASGNYPTANAGEDQSVQEGETVTLDGSASLEGSYGIASWKWTQTVGEKEVVLSDEAAQEATFVAPNAEAASSLTFQLTVTDNNGSTDSDTVTITISDNGITGFPEGVTTFKTADGSKSLGVSIVGDGDFVLLKGKHKEFISDDTSRPNDMIYDLLEFQIKVENPGDEVNLILYFPESLGEDYACYKYSSTYGWYPYDESYIQFDTDRQKAYMILVDGGTGDDDGESDAMVTDPLTFGTAPSDDPDTSDSGGGGGGGCFIDSLFE